MNYFITGGTGFIGTHLAHLLHEVHPEVRIYNLDIVKPGTPLPTVKNYKPVLRKGEEHAATFIYCDVRQPRELEKVELQALAGKWLARTGWQRMLLRLCTDYGRTHSVRTCNVRTYR